jgi:hypothetical protein
MYSCNSTAPIRFHGVNRDKFVLTFSRRFHFSFRRNVRKQDFLVLIYQFPIIRARIFQVITEISTFS